MSLSVISHFLSSFWWRLSYFSKNDTLIHLNERHLSDQILATYSQWVLDDFIYKRQFLANLKAYFYQFGFTIVSDHQKATSYQKSDNLLQSPSTFFLNINYFRSSANYILSKATYFRQSPTNVVTDNNLWVSQLFQIIRKLHLTKSKILSLLLDYKWSVNFTQLIAFGCCLDAFATKNNFRTFFNNNFSWLVFVSLVFAHVFFLGQSPLQLNNS